MNMNYNTLFMCRCHSLATYLMVLLFPAHQLLRREIVHFCTSVLCPVCASKTGEAQWAACRREVGENPTKGTVAHTIICCSYLTYVQNENNDEFSFPALMYMNSKCSYVRTFVLGESWNLRWSKNTRRVTP